MKDKVYCTSDGDYPENGQMVMFEDDGIIYIGGYLADSQLWFTDEEEFDNKPVDEPIYWKPLLSLREQYEEQNDMEINT